jgi:hypothetical protein
VQVGDDEGTKGAGGGIAGAVMSGLGVTSSRTPNTVSASAVTTGLATGAAAVNTVRGGVALMGAAMAVLVALVAYR